MTTTESCDSFNPTIEQVHALSSEAANHGDHLQVAICDRALGCRPQPDLALSVAERAHVADMSRGDAMAECARVIAATEAAGHDDAPRQAPRYRSVGADPMPIDGPSRYRHNSNADMMTALQTPAGQLPLDVAARRLSGIEALRNFALSNNEVAFAHLCTAALSEEWALARIVEMFDTGAGFNPGGFSDAGKLVIIRATDTSRPDGAIAKTAVNP